MPRKTVIQKKVSIVVTEEDVKSFVVLKQRQAKIDKKLVVKKDLFNSYAESVGFEEDRKVIIERGKFRVTVSETSSMRISADALNLIETDKRFKNYASCIETIKVVNSDLLMGDLENDLANGIITKEFVEELVSTITGTRVTTT